VTLINVYHTRQAVDSQPHGLSCTKDFRSSNINHEGCPPLK
jgi:hypothetical protein